jgi:hypothetical protein
MNLGPNIDYDTDIVTLVGLNQVFVDVSADDITTLLKQPNAAIE